MDRRTFLSASAVAGAAALVGCAPGASPTPSTSASTGTPSASASSIDPAKLGDVTLTVWDQEVRGGGSAQYTTLVKSFQAKYPNIKIKQVSRSFDDLVKTLRLALSGNDAPDVTQCNNARSQMGQFVAAKLLRPMDEYAASFGWDKRFSQSLRATSSYSTDGKQFGQGSLYGLPQVGEMVGIFVNTDNLAKVDAGALAGWDSLDWAGFESLLGKAKAAGQVPLMLGNVDKWPAIHVFGVVQGQHTKAADIRTLGYGNPGASWETPENTKSMEILADWVSKGYFNQGFNGFGYDPAWQGFSKGTGVFLIAGSWLTADLQKAMGDKVQYLIPPPATSGGVTYTTGATGIPWSISSKCKNPEAAAAFIDHLTNPDAMKVIAQTGNLPVVDSAEQTAPNKLSQELFKNFAKLNKDDALVPYLDWATPTMGDTLGAALQNLLGGKQTPAQALAAVQKDYAAFTAK